MDTSLICFFNQSGIVCASDTDMSMYSLCDKEPAVIAVNPYSPIPWQSIMDSHKMTAKKEIHENFEDYIKDFEVFLSKSVLKIDLEQLTDEDKEVLFLGFGSEDFFPIAIKASLGIGESGYTFNIEQYYNVNDNYGSRYTHYLFLGHIREIEPMLRGSNIATLQSMATKASEIFQKYVDYIAETMANTSYGNRINEYFNNCDFKSYINNNVLNLNNELEDRFNIAIDSMNIEDMVENAEIFVDSKNTLKSLKENNVTYAQRTKEIAVINRTEGFTWVKHSIYAI